jgi:hypothetical protein
MPPRVSAGVRRGVQSRAGCAKVEAMSRPFRALLAAAVVGLGSSCGIPPEEVLYLKEGETTVDLPYCTQFGCPSVGQFCVELFFEFGRSPPLCVLPEVCNRLQCREGRRCAIFDGFPGQVRCIPDSGP